jgi:Flp pilus assembly pilin Flp
MFQQADVLLTYMRARLGLRNEEGQALVEYALIISLVALIAVAGLTFAGGRVSSMFSAIGSKLNVNP